MLDYRIPYIYKNRQVLLPWVEDWTDDQNNIRDLPIGKGGTDDIKWLDWFWCHPSAYRLFTDSLYISGCLTTFFIGTMGLIFWNKSFGILFYIISALFAGVGKYKSRNYKAYYGKTFYDTQMKDIKVSEIDNLELEGKE